MRTSSRSRKHAEYTVGWICALEVELRAARAMLDEVHEELPRKSGDDNLYTLGSIGAHNVVIVCLPMGIMGTNCAAAVTKDLRRSFESIEFGVMVGIGGGIPTKVDIRLGDVAVSKPDGQHGGVVQYDFGKTVDYGHPLRVGTLNKPHPLLLGAASTLAARHREGDPEFHKHIEKMVESRPELNSDAVYPGEQSDQLFDATYQHESRFSTCDQCDPCRVTPRQPRMVKSPVIHYGNIASGNQVMRDARTRDQLAHQENVICFEMEAAGFMDRLPCLVVRGICDYADSHKNKKWQPYAAVVAAAYAKELLLIVQPLTALDVKEDRRDRENRMETMKTWVSPLDFYKHETAIFDGTFEAGQWLIEDPIFKGWKSKARMPAEIYCEGGHGSGKTVLSSIILNHLRKAYEDDLKTLVFSIFIQRQSRDQNPQDLYASLIRQLMEMQSDSFDIEGVQYLYHRARHTARPPTRDLEKLLEAAVMKMERAFIVVDDLDELEEGPANELVDMLHALPADKVSLMFTSRPGRDLAIPDTIDCDACRKRDKNVFWKFEATTNGAELYICSECQMMKKGPTDANPPRTVHFNIKAPLAEVGDFIRLKIDKSMGFNSDHRTKLGRILANKPELQKDILLAISKKAGNNYRIAELYTKELLRLSNERAIRIMLKGRAKDLDELYTSHIETSINKDDKELALKVLPWVVHQRRPMSFMELQQAIAIECLGEKDFPEGWETDEETIMTATAGLLHVDFDKTVSFSHHTLREYFSENKEHCSKWFPDAPITLNKNILAFLGYDEFSKPCANRQELKIRLQKYPLLAYASEHWLDYLRDVNLNEGDGLAIRAQAISLLRNSNRLSSTIQAAPMIWDDTTGVNGLHVCAQFGFAELIPELIEAGLPVDGSDSWLGGKDPMSESDFGFDGPVSGLDMDLISKVVKGRTPLMVACQWGQKDTVAKLLDAHANPNIYSLKGTSALLNAIEQGTPKATESDIDEIIKLILKAGADINHTYPERNDRSVLMILANRVHVNAVQYIVAQEHPKADINLQDATTRTVLMIAAEIPENCSEMQKYEMMLESLLTRSDLDVNLPCKLGKTALHYAVEGKANEKIVRALLNKGADPAIKCKEQDSNAAVLAVESGNLAAIATLLKSYPSLLTSTNSCGQGLLHLAAVQSWLEGMNFLIEKGLDVNSLCQKHGETPLHNACQLGDREAAKLLMDHGADLSIKDKYQRTPYLLAWQHGKDDITFLLESSDRFNKEVLPNPDSVPTWAMVAQRRREELDYRLASLNPRLDENDPDGGYSALHVAVNTSQLSVLQILLENHGPVNARDEFGRTALATAADCGNAECVSKLLDYGANIEIQDIWGNTALYLAQCNEHWNVALRLVEAGASATKNAQLLQRLLFKAVQMGRPRAVRRILAQGADRTARIESGCNVYDLLKDRRIEKAAHEELLSALNAGGECVGGAW